MLRPDLPLSYKIKGACPLPQQPLAWLAKSTPRKERGTNGLSDKARNRKAATPLVFDFSEWSGGCQTAVLSVVASGRESGKPEPPGVAGQRNGPLRILLARRDASTATATTKNFAGHFGNATSLHAAT